MEKPTPIMPEAQSLYKERMSSAGYLEQKLAEIKAVAEGEPLFDKLTEAEKAELLTEEDVYGERLEGLVQANIRTVRLVLSYFKTEEGKATLKAFTKSEDIPEDDEGLKIFFLQNADVLSQMNGEDRDELTNSASVYENKRLRDSLLSGATDDGKLAITNQEASERLTINLDPEKSLTKIDGLRALKQEIKGKLAEVREMGQDPLAESKALIYEMYLSRINISIAGTEAPRTGLREKARLLGVDSLNEAEKRLLGVNGGEVQQKSQDEADRINARYDKFIYGASPDYRDGWQQQVGREILEYTDQMGKVWLESELAGDEQIRAHGLDPKKLNRNDISSKEVAEKARELLSTMGLLSEQSDYNPDRTGAASDGKWQVYIPPQNPSNYLTSSRKVYNLKDREVSVITEMKTSLGHEPTHILQQENKSKIPLRLFKKVGGGGAIVLKEGGAKLVESAISEELFGVTSPSRPHYIRGMVARQNGGDYLQVVKAYYESHILPKLTLYKEGKIGQEAFEKAKKSSLMMAVKKSKRIMTGSKLNSNSGHLTSSEPTAYLEGAVIAEKLKEAGLGFVFNVADVSLDNMVRLLRLGFLSKEKISTLNLDYHRQLWESEKHKYLQ